MLNSSKSRRASVRDFSEPSRISVVSSAYWLTLISFPLIKARLDLLLETEKRALVF